MSTVENKNKNIEQKKILIVSGGHVDYDWAQTWLKNKNFDYCIAADSGLVHADKLEIPVNYILGDYDSVDAQVLSQYRDHTQVVTYPTEKDYTDTHLAILTAVRVGATQIEMIGATGSRYDHAMTNIYNMQVALERKIPCFIYDPNNKIYLADSDFTIEQEQQYGQFISFVPVTEQVMITLKGVKYPLEKYNLTQGLSICQSNEIVDKQAQILIEKGRVVVFETKD